MPGPPPTPTALKALRGNPGKRALNKREPKARRCAGDPPVDLMPEARAVWDRLAPKCIAMGTLLDVDADEFAKACRLEAAGNAKMTEWETSGEGGMHAAMKLWRQSSSIFARYGIGASDRSRIQLGAAPEKKSRWAGMGA